MPEHGCFETQYRIMGKDSDCFSQCQASALLSYLQETGFGALAEAGLTRACLLERYHAFWVLARLRLTLKTPIFPGDVITIRSWSRDAHGMGIYRDYDILRGGEEIGRSLALWMLTDTQNRSLFPAGSVPELRGVFAVSPHGKEELGRIDLPDGLVPVQKRTIYYSQADMNGHLNNSRYADLICDAIGMEKQKGAFVSFLRLSYLSECLPGCVLKLSALCREGVWYVRGTDGDKSAHFEAEVKLGHARASECRYRVLPV